MAAASSRGDHVTDWLEELHRVTSDALPPAAVALVIRVIDSFAAEDGSLRRSAVEARMLLVAALEPSPIARTSVPDPGPRLAERARTGPPPRLVQSAA